MKTPKELDAFLEKANNSLIHYSPQYLNFLSKAISNIEIKTLETRLNGTLSIYMPYAISHSSLGSVVNSLPFFGSHGGPICMDNSVDSIRLIQNFCAELKEIKPISTTIVENPFRPLDEQVLACAKFYEIDKRISQVTYLPNKCPNMIDSLFSKLHVKTRNSVRKGQKLDCSIIRTDDKKMWAWMQKTHHDSISALGGIPKSLNTFMALRDAFQDDCQLWIASIDGQQPIAGLVIIRYRTMAEYFTPVIDPLFKSSQALSALIFHVMIEMIKLGCTAWNWGGTWPNQEGVYRFKKRWGASDKNYRYFMQNQDIPELNLSPKEARKHFPNFYVFKY